MISEQRIIELEWRDIPEFDNYKISNLGDVVNKISGRYLSIGINHGYKQVALSKNGKSITKKIHSLLMISFVGPRPKGYHICHSDGNRLNNDLSNLRYCTCKENAADMVLHGTSCKGARNGMNVHPELRPKEEKHGRAKLTNDIVRKIKHDLIYDISWGKLTRIAKRYGTTIFTIYRINKGLDWKTIEFPTKLYALPNEEVK